VPQPDRSKEQVENHGRVCTQVGEGAENTKEKSRQCFKTKGNHNCMMKIQRKNPGSVL
jgi:hypothetical protein